MTTADQYREGVRAAQLFWRRGFVLMAWFGLALGWCLLRLIRLMVGLFEECPVLALVVVAVGGIVVVRGAQRSSSSWRAELSWAWLGLGLGVLDGLILLSGVAGK